MNRGNRTKSKNTGTSQMARQSYKIGELFAGAGGMALGAHNAGNSKHKFEHIWVNDIDKDACATFAKNFNLDAKNIVCKNVEELNFKKLPPIDGLAFGFPCNDFSIVSEQAGISGEYGRLYEFGVAVLKQSQPLFFVAENVSGIASSGNDVEIIEQALTEAGYKVVSHKYKFEEYGVPQARHRIIWVGFRSNLGIEFEHPLPTHKNKPKTVQDALKDISKDAPNHDFTNHPQSVIDRLSYIKPGENAFTATNIPDHLKLNLKSGAKISQIYKRLTPDKPSYTVTGSGGGGTHVYHWKENRALTNRERARLQSFPDWFEFVGSKPSVRKQIGMAVPPDGAEVIFKKVLQTLIDYRVPSQCKKTIHLTRF